MARPRLIYDFLKVTDEWFDVRAPALARLLSVQGRKVSVGDALALLLRLDRHVLRSVDDDSAELEVEFERCGFFPAGRAQETLTSAAQWPAAKGLGLIGALTDAEVRYLEPTDGGWRVRGLWERYGRFALERRASRVRTRDNARARAAGWAPGDGKTWVHRATGQVADTLKDALAQIEKEAA